MADRRQRQLATTPDTTYGSRHGWIARGCALARVVVSLRHSRRGDDGPGGSGHSMSRRTLTCHFEQRPFKVDERVIHVEKIAHGSKCLVVAESSPQAGEARAWSYWLAKVRSSREGRLDWTCKAVHRLRTAIRGADLHSVRFLLLAWTHAQDSCGQSPPRQSLFAPRRPTSHTNFHQGSGAPCSASHLCHRV